ncbi:hypothetical protein ScPMuIL_007617 [Solemya velum]
MENTEDIQGNLATYLLQLQQVESSLTTDPENEELLKLKRDLLEVIELTQELLGTKASSLSKAVQSEEPTTADDTEDTEEETKHEWQIGEKCMAIWSKDGGYYSAVVDEILEDGSCTVKFDVYDNTELTDVSLLKIQDPNSISDSAAKSKSKKDLIAKQREYKRKKNQKKAQRLQKMEEERESEKNKWLDFNVKTFSRTTKGKVKKSIFATPENVHGRVGVGTCGVGGKPMTSYSHQEKWKK